VYAFDNNLDKTTEPQSCLNETLNQSLQEEMRMEFETVEQTPSEPGPSKKSPTKKQERIISPEEINLYLS